MPKDFFGNYFDIPLCDPLTLKPISRTPVLSFYRDIPQYMPYESKESREECLDRIMAIVKHEQEEKMFEFYRKLSESCAEIIRKEQSEKYKEYILRKDILDRYKSDDDDE